MENIKTVQNILRCLLYWDRPLTAKEISNKYGDIPAFIQRNPRYIYKHLRQMELNGLIKKAGKKICSISESDLHKKIYCNTWKISCNVETLNKHIKKHTLIIPY
jgi:repressor of nif and glnA expression